MRKFLTSDGIWMKVLNPVPGDNPDKVKQQCWAVAKRNGKELSVPFRYVDSPDPTPKKSKEKKGDVSQPKYGEQLKFKF